jgi:glutamine amidotransferase
MGNLRSVEKAFEHLGEPCRVSSDLRGCSKLVIPGVGAFGAAMNRLQPMREQLRDMAVAGVPILGICLGQQLLFETSEEMGQYTGLGLIPGTVRYLPRDLGLKVPHIGWSAITPLARCEVLAETTPGDQVYFVHSLYTECSDPAHVAATAEYGIVFPAAVRKDNVWGLQFHPEKSGNVGLSMLRRFAEC